MIEYIRKYPQFSLCGLNCGLCSWYYIDGPSRCPGCGGPNFHHHHTSCPVITCNRKHDTVEYCFQCPEYPCERFKESGKEDSFISYRNVLTDFQLAKEDLALYQDNLNRKIEILKLLLDRYNDGRRKNFYCMAVNLLPLDDLIRITEIINTDIDAQDPDPKTKAARVVALINEYAQERGLELKLRK